MLTDEQYEAALADLADYEKRIAEAGKLEQTNTLTVAARLDQLFRDERWIAERNAERMRTAKTDRGGRPVDPSSRSQFSTWVRGRFNQFAPQVTYRLLDAHWIASSFLTLGEVTPSSERPVRALKVLTKPAHGGGSRIPEVWQIACRIASESGRTQPTTEDVRHGIAEWNHQHLAQGQERTERAIDRADLRRRKAEAAWKDLIAIAGTEQINAFLAVVEKDIAALEETGRKA